MAEINKLTSVDSVSASDQVPIYSASNGDARKVSMTNLRTFMTNGIASDTHSATNKITPVDADEFPIADSAASFALKKVNFGNLTTWIKAIFSPAGGAALIGNTPAGNIAATTVQAALNELDTEKALLAGSSTQVFSAAAAAAATNVVRADQNKNELTSVSATIATGKLTLGLQPCIINFRNSDVTNGASNTKFVSTALTLATDNNGASFGLTTAVQGRLIMLAIDNGTATPVLGVVNLSGGTSLTEEGILTSTTAITGAVVSSTTVYTTVALGAGLYPYKVVGAVDITWTSGSGYITTPALVTGAGGNALTAMSSLGYGAVQRNGVDITRVLNTTYYTSSRPRFVAANVTIATATDTAVLLVNGNIVQEGFAASVGNYSSVEFPIPPYSSYLIKQAGNPASGAIRYWSEL